MKKTKTIRSSFLMILPFVLAPGFALAQTALCSDGWVSNSAHFQGTCADHGGVRVWLNKEMEEQANEWCDELSWPPKMRQLAKVEPCP